MIDEAKFNRFSISLKDFEKVIALLEETKKHPTNSIVYESLVFTAIVCYFRPFSPNEKPSNRVVPRLSLEDFLPLTSDELAIHELCKKLRNKALAHAEIKYHSIDFDISTGGISSELFSLVGNAPDLTKFMALTQKLIRECRNKRADYVWKVQAP